MADYTGKKAGNYTILRKLGDGGFASVFLAHHDILEKQAAVKFLLEEWVNEPEVVSRFLDEARTMERLNDHPNIVQIIDVASKEICEREGLPPYFVMEFVDGCSLEKRIHSSEPISLEFILDIAKNALSALEYCHKKGVIHRDIKPSNILLTSSGKVQLTDFGIAKARLNTSKTSEGIALGSTDYMSPEQALGKRDLDHRSDIYSFGITLYEMVVGQLPFISENPNQVAIMHIQDSPKAPISYSEEVPERLNYLIMKAIEKKPENRFQSCKEMSELVELIMNPNTPVSGPVQTMDLSELKSENPEDSLRTDSDELQETASKRITKIQQNQLVATIRGGLRIFAIFIAFTVIFLGSFKAFFYLTEGTLSVQTTPSSAKIFLNGSYVGTSPVDLRLSPSSYRVSITFPGYDDNFSSAHVQARQAFSLQRTLRKSYPDLLERFQTAQTTCRSALSSSGKGKAALIKDAMQKIETLLDECLDSSPIHEEYIEFCSKHDLLVKAETFYKLRSQKNPSNVLLLTLLGRAQLLKRDMKNSLDTLSKAWEIDSNDTLLLNTLGDYFTENKNLEKARQYFQLSLFLNPNQPQLTSKGIQ